MPATTMASWPAPASVQRDGLPEGALDRGFRMPRGLGQFVPHVQNLLFFAIPIVIQAALVTAIENCLELREVAA
jgi:hypothetical protein